MARIRTIKPEFFTSEDIVALSPFARLLYVALWCEADREGRMVWRPKTFKMRYFPADAVDIDGLCKELTDAGLVRLYGDGLAYVPKFAEHQHINPREQPSKLPSPLSIDASATRRHASGTVTDAQVGREGKGKEGNSLVDPDGSTCPPVADGDESDAVYVVPDCPIKAIVELYHDTLPSLGRVEVLNDFRQGLIRTRWREVCAAEKFDRRQGLDWFRDFFGHVADSPFLMGKAPAKPGDRPFLADLEWLVRPQNFAKVIEGKYHRKAA